MKRLLSASLALALGLQLATAQSSRVFVLEGLYTNYPSVDVSDSGVWLAAQDVGLQQRGSYFEPFVDGVKVWNLMIRKVYSVPNDTRFDLAMLRFVPGTDNLAILGRGDHLTVHRPIYFIDWQWLPLARFYVEGVTVVVHN